MALGLLLVLPETFSRIDLPGERYSYVFSAFVWSASASLFFANSIRRFSTFPFTLSLGNCPDPSRSPAGTVIERCFYFIEDDAVAIPWAPWTSIEIVCPFLRGQARHQVVPVIFAAAFSIQHYHVRGLRLPAQSHLHVGREHRVRGRSGEFLVQEDHTSVDQMRQPDVMTIIEAGKR